MQTYRIWKFVGGEAFPSDDAGAADIFTGTSAAFQYQDVVPGGRQPSRGAAPGRTGADHDDVIQGANSLAVPDRLPEVLRHEFHGAVVTAHTASGAASGALLPHFEDAGLV